MNITDTRMMSVLNYLKPYGKRSVSISGKQMLEEYPDIGPWQLSILLSKMVDLGLLDITAGKELQAPGKTWVRRYMITTTGMSWTPESPSQTPEMEEFIRGVGDKWRRVPGPLVGQVRRSDRDVWEVATFVRVRGAKDTSS